MNGRSLMSAKCHLAILALAACITQGAAAQSISQCDGVLVPSEESRKSDYALLQAFAKVNASELYDTIAKTDGKSAGGGGGYGGFSADYQQSSSKSDFQERVQKRLVTENFQMSESDAKAYYRRGVSDSQVNAWSECITRVSGGGAVLLSARNIDERGFFLVVTWIPPVATGAAKLELRATGGTISGHSSLSEDLSGRGAKTYEVVASSTTAVKVLANIAGATDSVMVANTLKRPMPSLQKIKRERLCSESDRCPSDAKVLACLSSHDRPTEVPPGVWLVHPNSKDYNSAQYKTTAVQFGNWSNAECGLSGDGWHARVGSCGKGTGNRWQRCEQVRVEVETLE